MTESLSDIREIAIERAGNRCEWAYCGDNKWLELAHIQGIGMGGSKKRKFDINNVAILCKYHHDIYDGRQRVGTSVAYRDLLKGFLKRESNL
jgi:predicted restriction endonuclease